MRILFLKSSIERTKWCRFPFRMMMAPSKAYINYYYNFYLQRLSITYKTFCRGWSHAYVHMQEIALRMERKGQRVFQTQEFRSWLANITPPFPRRTTRSCRSFRNPAAKKVLLNTVGPKSRLTRIASNSDKIFIYRRAVYGKNSIDVPVRSVMQLLVLEVLNPFYIFQVASIIIWIMIWYYFYAGAIAVMS